MRSVLGLLMAALPFVHANLSRLPYASGGVSCIANEFHVQNVAGTNILALEATQIANLSLISTQGFSMPAGQWEVDFCNVTITYEHPGLNDSIRVEVWLPEKHLWNGRFLGLGGGGFNGGYPLYYSTSQYPLGANYATMITDVGHAWPPLDNQYVDPSNWALATPGAINFNSVANFGSVALNDAAIFGQAVTEIYYGRPAHHKYFNGCSQGDRQAHMLAQRYPDAYDGILAAAPAINIQTFAGLLWPQVVMYHEDTFPNPCELAAITEAAIESCDALDGLKDGIISNIDQCWYNAEEAIGRIYNCSGHDITVSTGAAKVANAIWNGPRKADGTLLWYGLARDADLRVNTNTTCSYDDICVSGGSALGQQFISNFVFKTPTIHVSNITYEDYEDIIRIAKQEYDSIFGTSDADLARFKRSGGKFLAWHGLADELIPVNSTRDYYRRVLDLDKTANDYYRLFEAPGVAHCYSGPGPYPDTSLDVLVDWVENKNAPETLPSFNRQDGQNLRQQPLCRYPLVSVYTGGNQSDPKSWDCKQSFA